MRKLLLASAAMLGGTLGLASVASAQLQTQYPYTPPAGSTPVSTPSTATPIPQWATLPPVSTGNLTVRFGGRLTTYFGAFSDSGRNPSAITLSSGGKQSLLSTGNAKLAPYAVAEYARLYPSFDGLAANGLKYGAFLEIRQENYAAPGSTGGNSILYATSQRGNLYFKRETGYIGTDNLGFLRFGATDQPSSLFITGTFENFDEGGWNFQSYPGQFSYNSIPTWPFPDTGNLYTQNKIVYLSPKFADLVDFGLSFAPNTGNDGAVGGACPYAIGGGVTAGSSTGPAGVAGYGCDALSSSNVSNDQKRPRNIFDAVARLRTSVGPAGIALTLGGFFSGTVAYNGTAPVVGAGAVARTDGLAVFDTGLAVTYGGLTVGGHLDYGKFNNGYTASPQGSGDSLAWIAGASYAFGSAIVGLSYFQFQSPGNWSYVATNATTGASYAGRTQTQTGLAAGGTLALAPGAWVFLSYLYGTRHQSGVDLLANSGPSVGTSDGRTIYSGAVLTHNNVDAQAIVVGTTFKW